MAWTDLGTVTVIDRVQRGAGCAVIPFPQKVQKTRLMLLDRNSKLAPRELVTEQGGSWGS